MLHDFLNLVERGHDLGNLLQSFPKLEHSYFANGESLLHVAVKAKLYGLVCVILQRGVVDVNIVDFDSFAASHYATDMKMLHALLGHT
jgi:hypothetical protein